MSLTLSSDAIDRLQSKRCRFIPKLFIYRDYLGEDTYWDLTDRVVKWGKLSGHSTLVRVSWQIPGVTLQLRNDDGYLSVQRSDSFWIDVADHIPTLCAAFVGIYLDMGPNREIEQVYRYMGKINDVVYSTVRNAPVAELVTTMYQDRGMSRLIPKEFKYVTVPENSGLGW